MATNKQNTMALILHRRIVWICLPLLCVFLLNLLYPRVDLLAGTARAIELSVKAIPLDPDNPHNTNVGGLRYIEGYQLDADDFRFGGWSGLRAHLIGDDIQYTAISDAGWWLRGIVGKAQAKLHPFDPKAAQVHKSDYDSESLIRFGQQGFLVAFEQNHRIQSVSRIGALSQRHPFSDIISGFGLSKNGGIEAMTWLTPQRGSLFMIAEKGQDSASTLPAWVLGTDMSVTKYRFKPPHNYAPTDAVTLDNGTVLILTRRYTVIDGVSMKLVKLPSSAFNKNQPVGDTLLVGGVIASIKPPLNIDNMEGLDAVRMPDGSIRLIMISDDNFRNLQRTLMLVFELT